MQIILLGKSKGDLKDWKMSGDIFALNKIRKLIEDIQKTPFEGLGKPEALKYNLSGKWSRRITEKDRLVYEISGNEIKIYSLKGHYEKNK
jgi:toxin YoeB